MTDITEAAHIIRDSAEKEAADPDPAELLHARARLAARNRTASDEAFVDPDAEGLAERARIAASQKGARTQVLEAAEKALELGRRGALATAQFSHTAARTAAVQALELSRRAGEMRHWIPVLKRYGTTMWQTSAILMHELEQSEAFQVRKLEDLPSFAESMSRLTRQLDSLMAEIRSMPREAAVAAAIVVVRVLATLNNLGDAAVRELLHGRTALSRLGLVTTVAPGYIAVYHYRRILLRDLNLLPITKRLAQLFDVDRIAGEPSGPDEPEVLDLAPSQPDVVVGCETLKHLQWHTQLARNFRRMPPAFWVAGTASSCVTLQVCREQSEVLIKWVFRFRLKMLLSLVFFYSARNGGQERFIELFNTALSRLPPDRQQLITSYLTSFQVAVCNTGALVSARLSPLVRRLLKKLLDELAKLGRSSLGDAASVPASPERAAPTNATCNEQDPLLFGSGVTSGAGVSSGAAAHNQSGSSALDAPKPVFRGSNSDASVHLESFASAAELGDFAMPDEDLASPVPPAAPPR